MPRRIIETLLIFLLFAMFAGQLPPDVNESHYLTKAKHGWDPAWCSGDLFLSSSFSHWLFYFAFSWLNQFFSLSAVAWIGRLLTWLLLAFAWQRLAALALKSPGLPILAAALFLILNARFHLAGEWVVGGFEAKGIAYFFVLLAVGSLIKKDYYWLWPQLGAACAFHVLVGGWATIASSIAILLGLRPSNGTSALPWQNFSPWRSASIKSLSQHWLPLTLGGLLTLAGLLPPLLADFGAEPNIKAQASYIYVVQRISHHLSFGDFSAARVAGFVLIIIGLFLVNRILQRSTQTQNAHWQLIFNFTLGSLLISLAGLMLSGVAVSETDSELSKFSINLLRFYWFRLSDFAVPLALSIGCSRIIQSHLENTRQPDQLTAGRWSRPMAMLAIAVLASVTAAIICQRHVDRRPPADRAALPNYPGSPKRTLETYENWRCVCDWIKNNTPEDAVFVTPAQQQTFKWYAQRSEVVNWKDVPQDAPAMVQWHRRVALFIQPQRNYPQGLLAYSDQQLVDYAQLFGATHLLIPQRHADMVSTSNQLKQLYPTNPTVKATYVVFELPQLPEASSSSDR